MLVDALDDLVCSDNPPLHSPITAASEAAAAEKGQEEEQPPRRPTEAAATKEAEAEAATRRKEAKAKARQGAEDRFRAESGAISPASHWPHTDPALIPR